MNTVKNETAKELLEKLAQAYGKSPENMYAKIEKIIVRCWNIQDESFICKLRAEFPDGKPTVEQILLSITENCGGDAS